MVAAAADRYFWLGGRESDVGARVLVRQLRTSCSDLWIRSAPGALVAADADQQCCGPAPERLVRERARHRVARHTPRTRTLGTTDRTHDTTLQHRLIRSEVLSDSFEAELVESAEGSAEALVESGVYAARATASIIMVSNSMGVSFPSRRCRRLR